MTSPGAGSRGGKGRGTGTVFWTLAVFILLGLVFSTMVSFESFEEEGHRFGNNRFREGEQKSPRAQKRVWEIQQQDSLYKIDTESQELLQSNDTRADRELRYTRSSTNRRFTPTFSKLKRPWSMVVVNNLDGDDGESGSNENNNDLSDNDGDSDSSNSYPIVTINDQSALVTTPGWTPQNIFKRNFNHYNPKGSGTRLGSKLNPPLPTFAPTARPTTKTPTASPTSIPTPSPTSASPIELPAPAPISAPGPVPAPGPAPIPQSPDTDPPPNSTEAPTKSPIKSPIVAPIPPSIPNPESPVENPTDAPTKTPTLSLSIAPTVVTVAPTDSGSGTATGSGTRP